MEDIKLKQALTYDNIKNTKRSYIPFTGEFQEVFSNPQDKGVWLIWGASGSGKSSFVMQLCAEFSKYYKVLYNSLEEDADDDDFFQRMERCGMERFKNNFNAVQDKYNELIKRLERKQSAKVVIIDSATYFFKGRTAFQDYLRLVRQLFPKKIFIITAHARGNNPEDQLEFDIMHDANMKVRVDAYGAYNKGRKYGKKNPYIIWEEKYEELQGAKNE